MDDVAKPVGSGYIAVNYTHDLRKRRPPFYFVFVKSVRSTSNVILMFFHRHRHQGFTDICITTG
jgi:hypothetical protein